MQELINKLIKRYTLAIKLVKYFPFMWEIIVRILAVEYGVCNAARILFLYLKRVNSHAFYQFIDLHVQKHSGYWALPVNEATNAIQARNLLQIRLDILKTYKL